MGRAQDHFGHGIAARWHGRRARRAQRAADRGARGVHRPGAAARRDRPAWRLERLGQDEYRGEPGQRPFGERGQFGRSHASGVEPEGAVELPRGDPGQVAADLARQWCGTRRCGCCRRRYPFCQQPEHRRPRPARHRLPPRQRRRGSHRREPCQHASGRRPEATRQGSGRRLPALHGTGTPAPSSGRHRFRHAGTDDHHHPAGRSRAHGRHADGQLGAQRLSDRQPVRARGASRAPGPEQAGRRPGLHRPAPVAELPEHRDPRPAADHRRLQ